MAVGRDQVALVHRDLQAWAHAATATPGAGVNGWLQRRQ
jgi:hypothetical protein